MLDLYRTKLNWHPDGRYLKSNWEANRNWIWGNSPAPPESVTELKSVLALDPRLRVLVAHGFTDFVTPYMGSELILDQIPDYGGEERLASVVYPGGHMFYSRDASRRAFREEALKLLERSLGNEPAPKVAP
jgi:carboxypeptidase C (cathepsin A)